MIRYYFPNNMLRNVILLHLHKKNQSEIRKTSPKNKLVHVLNEGCDDTLNN